MKSVRIQSFSTQYFPASGQNYGDFPMKILTRKNSSMDTFFTVLILLFSRKLNILFRSFFSRFHLKSIRRKLFKFWSQPKSLFFAEICFRRFSEKTLNNAASFCKNIQKLINSKQKLKCQLSLLGVIIVSYFF